MRNPYADIFRAPPLRVCQDRDARSHDMASGDGRNVTFARARESLTTIPHAEYERIAAQLAPPQSQRMSGPVGETSG